MLTLNGHYCPSQKGSKKRESIGPPPLAQAAPEGDLGWAAQARPAHGMCEGTAFPGEDMQAGCSPTKHPTVIITTTGVQEPHEGRVPDILIEWGPLVDPVPGSVHCCRAGRAPPSCSSSEDLNSSSDSDPYIWPDLWS